MDPILRESLSSLGITPQNNRVLMLLPLVYVAWADGKMEDVEIVRIDQMAKDKFRLDKSGLDILDGWLARRPTRDYFNQGLQDLFLLAQIEEGDPLVHPEELHDLLVHSEAIARATAHALDAPTSVAPEEEDALKEIALVLGVDNGVSWRRLLDELEVGPGSITGGRVPRSRRL